VGGRVAVEALDLVLGLGPVWLAQLDDEAAVLGEVLEAGVLAVLAIVVHIALDHHRLHVSYRTVRGTPPNAAKARSRRPISVATMSLTYST
jgi:hypothetical protein